MSAPPVPSPRVTVVVPVHDRRERAVPSIDSALAQEPEAHDGLEVVVVDDGSTDGSAEFLEARYAPDPRVRVLRKRNGGVASARNAGFDAARAPLVALLDSDDLCLPGRLRRQAQALEGAPAAALCFCDAVYDRGTLGTLRMTSRHRFRWPTGLDALLEGGWAVPSTWMLRTPVARAVRFDETVRYQEDVDFLFRFYAEGHGAVVVEEPLVRYDDRPAAETSGPRMNAQRDAMREYGLWVFKRHWDRLPPEERARTRVPTRIRRLLVEHCVRTGRYRRARHHLLAWWRQRKLRGPLLVRWFRLLGRPEGPAPQDGPLGDLDIDA